MDIKVRSMEAGDWGAVRDIYEEGIGTGNATFETGVPAWEVWDGAHLETCRIVACRNDQVVGWAALSPISSRSVYAGVAEVSVYVTALARGQGIGRRLLQALVQASERAGIWTLQAGIFPENEASIALHKLCGFRIVGRRERLAQMHGAWRDVTLMERRSQTIDMERGGTSAQPI